MSTFPFLPPTKTTTPTMTNPSSSMITSLNPHPPALAIPTIAPRSGRNTSIPQLQLYNPAGKQLEVDLDLNLNVTLDTDLFAGEGDGGDTPQPGTVSDISQPLVRCRGQCYIRSMGDWWPMPAEMNVGPDDILSRMDVDQLPERGLYDDVSFLLESGDEADDQQTSSKRDTILVSPGPVHSKVRAEVSVSAMSVGVEPSVESPVSDI